MALCLRSKADLGGTHTRGMRSNGWVISGPEEAARSKGEAVLISLSLLPTVMESASLVTLPARPASMTPFATEPCSQIPDSVFCLFPLLSAFISMSSLRFITALHRPTRLLPTASGFLQLPVPTSTPSPQPPISANAAQLSLLA